jgi:hypothetical protein
MRAPRPRTLPPEDESQGYGERGGGRPMLLRASDWETEDNRHRDDDFSETGHALPGALLNTMYIYIVSEAA